MEASKVDLEEEIKKVQREYKTIEEYEGYPCTMYANDIEWIAKHFFELGMQVSNKKKKGVSEDLDEASVNYAATGEFLPNGKEMIDFQLEKAFKAGAKWQKEHFWKPADGDDLPEIDREVVVFTQNFPDDAGIMIVSIAHRPNPNGFDGKNLASGKVEHYTPETYDKGGWNIPDVKFWLDVELPKEIEL